MADKREKKAPVIYTIGHSTRTLEELVELLQTNEITLLADVRTVPKSRTNPQFNKETLGDTLKEYGIKYAHWAHLGGLRHARKDSENKVWQNASFRGYADYMETDEFGDAVDTLVKQSKKERIAIMCSEAVWWRCHRSMIADELVARGFAVKHIMNLKEPKPHTLRSFAHVEGGHVSYH